MKTQTQAVKPTPKQQVLSSCPLINTEYLHPVSSFPKAPSSVTPYTVYMCCRMLKCKKKKLNFKKYLCICVQGLTYQGIC